MPPEPDPAGTVVRQEGLPTVGLWLMPDNSMPGMLEDFIQMLVPPGDTLWSRATAAADAIAVAERRYPPSLHGKAQIYTWLAWQAEPGRPYGTAITARYLDASRPSGQAFVAWAAQLFGFPLP